MPTNPKQRAALQRGDEIRVRRAETLNALRLLPREVRATHFVHPTPELATYTLEQLFGRGVGGLFPRYGKSRLNRTLLRRNGRYNNLHSPVRRRKILSTHKVKELTVYERQQLIVQVLRDTENFDDIIV